MFSQQQRITRRRGPEVSPKSFPRKRGILTSNYNIPFLTPLRIRLLFMGSLSLLGLLGVVNFLSTTPDRNMTQLLLEENNNNDNNIKDISVVIMNHARPGNLQKSSLMPTLLDHPHITEVLLLHSNPSTAFLWDHPKIRHVNATDANAKFGLSLRFHFCATTAQNPWVLMVDDDMLIPKTTLQALIQEFSHNPHRIVGRFGRDLNYWRRSGLITHGYNTVGIKGPAEVILTKILIMEQEICQYFHHYAPLVEKEDPIAASLLANSHPYWNGEDIFMSLVANHVYGNGEKYDQATRDAAQRGHNHYAMPWLEVGDVGDQFKDVTDGRLDVSGNLDGMRQPWKWKPWDPLWRQNFVKAYQHLAFRGQFWKRAKYILQQQEG